MISLKEYAKNRSVTYEAVRRQVVRYREELGEHIVKQGRTQYLDDAAVAFLDERRKENPVVVFQMDKEEEIQRLREENKALLLRVTELQDELLREKDAVKQLQGEKIEQLEDKEPPQKKGFWERLFNG